MNLLWTAQWHLALRLLLHLKLNFLHLNLWFHESPRYSQKTKSWAYSKVNTLEVCWDFVDDALSKSHKLKKGSLKWLLQCNIWHRIDFWNWIEKWLSFLPSHSRELFWFGNFLFWLLSSERSHVFVHLAGHDNSFATLSFSNFEITKKDAQAIFSSRAEREQILHSCDSWERSVRVS